MTERNWGSGDDWWKPGTGNEPWRAILAGRKTHRSLHWSDPLTLWRARNDVFAKTVYDLPNRERQRWMAALGTPNPGQDDLTLKLEDTLEHRAFLIVGDPGEGDESQYAVVPPLLVTGAKTDFAVILSDVNYPVGDLREYHDRVDLPYRDYAGPIYALPGNHDWYDGLDGFMNTFCNQGVLPRRDPSDGIRRRFTRWLMWNRIPETTIADRGTPTNTDPQPGPYFMLDLGPVLAVAIDTGITGTVDQVQADWLEAVSKIDKPKILLTGRPLHVDARQFPDDIMTLDDRQTQRADRDWAIDQIVCDPRHRYIAVVGGDTHNYQHYDAWVGDKERERPLHFVVSGGGGAYLGATHKIPRVLDARVEVSEGLYKHIEGEQGFKCFPRRGDSIAYYALSYRARLWRLIALALAAIVASIIIGLLVDPHLPLGRDIGSSVPDWNYGPLLGLGLLAFGAMFIVGTTVSYRRSRHKPAPPTHARRRVVRCTLRLLALPMLFIGALAVIAPICRVTVRTGLEIVAVTPLVLLVGIVLAYPLAGLLVRPWRLRRISPGEHLRSIALIAASIAGAIAAMAVILAMTRAAGGPRAWPTYALAIVLTALGLALLVEAIRGLRAHPPGITPSAQEPLGQTPARARWSSGRLAMACSAVAAAVALAALTWPNWDGGDSPLASPWFLGCIIGLALGGFTVDSLTPEFASSSFQRGLVWLTGAALGTAGAASIELGDWHLSPLGPHRAAAAFILVGSVPLGVLGLAGALDPWVVFGRLHPDEASAYAARALREVPVRPAAQEMQAGDERVRPGADRRASFIQSAPANPGDMLHSKFAEIFDRNATPFFKSYLHVQICDDRLKFTCYGVSGRESEDDPGEIRDQFDALYVHDGREVPARVGLTDHESKLSIMPAPRWAVVALCLAVPATIVLAIALLVAA